MINRATLTVALNLAPQTFFVAFIQICESRVTESRERLISPLRWSQQLMPPRWWLILADLSIFISRTAWAYLNKSLAVAHQNQANVLECCRPSKNVKPTDQ